MQNLSSSSLLGIKSKFFGEILFDNILHLEGEITGKIIAKSSDSSVLLIGKHAVVKADIVADIVIVSGKFIGKAYVPVKLEIKKKGKCAGMIFTSDLIVQKKSAFHGQCFMLKHLDDKKKNSIKSKLLDKKQLTITPRLLEELRYPNYQLDSKNPKINAKT